ncbi:MAG TPA: hypothetical protein VIH54_09720, partial [Chthoniobacterales bacterium]
NPEGSHNHPARDARALAQGRLSLLLASEVAPLAGLFLEIVVIGRSNRFGQLSKRKREGCFNFF